MIFETLTNHDILQKLYGSLGMDHHFFEEGMVGKFIGTMNFFLTFTRLCVSLILWWDITCAIFF